MGTAADSDFGEIAGHSLEHLVDVSELEPQMNLVKKCFEQTEAPDGLELVEGCNLAKGSKMVMFCVLQDWRVVRFAGEHERAQVFQTLAARLQVEI